ncbi:hypothetical protein GCM10010365_44920 [Streptomyces poonensis]|uniref:Uncharacterized protein n=1 Tax=Streptomyces poonensis TaxID=68255 RepID=A0A918ULY5_9ACTN|nr:hypothetical protein GCM10010365_44920 [Streptomyces poonensis]
MVPLPHVVCGSGPGVCMVAGPRNAAAWPPACRPCRSAARSGSRSCGPPTRIEAEAADKACGHARADDEGRRRRRRADCRQGFAAEPKAQAGPARPRLRVTKDSDGACIQAYDAQAASRPRDGLATASEQ